MSCFWVFMGLTGAAWQVSGFPNMTAIALEDATGRTYVKTWDFLKVGVPSSLVSYVVVVTVGYLLMVYANGW